jgi:hypothetical protein
MDGYPLLTETAAGAPLSEVWVQFDVHPATSRQGLTEVRLHAGVVDEVAVEFFCYGGCCLLAAAMHERSGWPLMAYYVNRPDGKLAIAHLGVMTPEEEFLDVQGVRSYGDLVADYGQGWRRTHTLAEAVALDAISADGWRSNLGGEHIREIVWYFAEQTLLKATLADSIPQGGTPS